MQDTNNATITNMMQEKVAPIQICSYPFYQFAIGANDYLYPCSIRLGEANSHIGNVAEYNLSEFWNGRYYSEFRLDYLDGKIEKCSACNISKMTLQQEDNIDSCREALVSYYEKIVK